MFISKATTHMKSNSVRETFSRPRDVFETILTAKLPYGRHRIRLVVIPVGEDESALPMVIEFEATGDAILQNTSIASMINPRSGWTCVGKEFCSLRVALCCASLYAKLSQIKSQMKRDQPSEGQ